MNKDIPAILGDLKLVWKLITSFNAIIIDCDF